MIYKKTHKAKKRKLPPVGVLVCGELGDDTIKQVWETYDGEREYFLTLCSPGGCITVYHALIDFLEDARESGRLTTIAMGQCMSGASILVAAGTPGQRLTYKNTLFGVHEPFLTEVMPDPASQHIMLQQLSIIKNQYYDFLSKFTKHRQEWWREKLQGISMFHLTAREAIKVGLVDMII